MGSDARGTVRRRLVVVLAAGLVPWIVLKVGSDLTLVFAFGLVNADPIGVTTVTDYVFRFTGDLPGYLLAWPVGVLLYVGAVASAATGIAGREDVRVTAALLALAGASELWTTLGFLRRPTYLVLPLGTVVLWTVAWWYYWPAVREALLYPRE